MAMTSRTNRRAGAEKDRPILFGVPVFPPRQGFSLTSQVREILLEQILSGRWEVGQRLPSVAA